MFASWPTSPVRPRRALQHTAGPFARLQTGMDHVGRLDPRSSRSSPAVDGAVREVPRCIRHELLLASLRASGLPAEVEEGRAQHLSPGLAEDLGGADHLLVPLEAGCSPVADQSAGRMVISEPASRHISSAMLSAPLGQCPERSTGRVAFLGPQPRQASLNVSRMLFASFQLREPVTRTTREDDSGIISAIIRVSSPYDSVVSTAGIESCGHDVWAGAAACMPLPHSGQPVLDPITARPFSRWSSTRI